MNTTTTKFLNFIYLFIKGQKNMARNISRDISKNMSLRMSFMWAPIFFACGIILFFTSTNPDSHALIWASTLLILALLAAYFDRFSYAALFYIFSGLILLGFLWSFSYQKFIILDKQITGKIFADVKGEITHIKSITSAKNNKTRLSLIISNPTLYKTSFRNKKSQKTKIIKKKSPKKMTKKFRKLLKKCDQNSSCENKVKNTFKEHEANKKLRREERRRKRAKKISVKEIENSFLNLKDYQEIDREFLGKLSNYQKVNWIDKDGRKAFPNPPKKVSISVYSDNKDLKIGDIISLRVMLQPPKKREFLNEFNYATNAASKNIGGYGYAISKITQHISSENSSFSNFIGKLRKKVEKRIKYHFQKNNSDYIYVKNYQDKAAIAIALITGSRGSISEKSLENIRNSGLAHLLAISGLHMAICALIFFSFSRFVLSRSEYLTIHFNIKKIAAIIAIIGSFFYLQLAGSPISATRSFIMVSLVLIAIVFDKKTDLRRCVALAFLALLIANPYNIFAIGFQLSFAAILSIACFHEFLEKLKYHPNNYSENSSFIRKFFWYFFEIALASIIVQIATAPFLIYHFQKLSALGILSNMLAIPLTSFVTMPLGFLSVFLMPLGLEKFSLELMGISISWILEIANFVSHVKYSHFTTPRMPEISFAFAVSGWLMICLVKGKLKWLGCLISAFSMFFLFITKQPNLLLDGKQKFFAIYNKEDGLVFSKTLRKSRKRDLWMREMGENKHKSFAEFPEKWHKERGIKCDSKKCEIKNKSGKYLILLSRNKISEICQSSTTKDYDMVINLTGKYKIPDCFNEKIVKIDNVEFYNQGGHFLFFNEENSTKNLTIKTAR